MNLGKFTINKRPVTVEVADKEINVNEALPNDFSDYSVSNLANGDNREDAIMQMPSFTWGMDGTSVGEFNISTSTAINYTNNYIPASTALRGVLKVKAAQSNPQQQQTPGTQPQPQQPQTPGMQQPQQQLEKKKPSDIVTPGKSGSEDNKERGKATPSVPKKPENNGGGKRKGRN